MIVQTLMLDAVAEIQRLKDDNAKLMAALKGTLTVIDAMQKRAPAAMGPGFQKWRGEIVKALANKEERKAEIKMS